MVPKASQERVKTLLKDTITLLCKNGLEFKDNFSVEALIGVTLDNDEVFLISMNEIVKADKVPLDDLSEDSGRNDIPDTTSVHGVQKVKKNKKRRLSHSTEESRVQVKREPSSPLDPSDVGSEIQTGSFNTKPEDLWGEGDPPSLSVSTLEGTSSESISQNQPVKKTSNFSHAEENPADEDDEGQEHSEDEDLVFIKEEVADSVDADLQSPSFSSLSFQQDSQFSNSGYGPELSHDDNNMLWSQSSQVLQQRNFTPRGSRTSTVTSDTLDQSSELALPLDQQQQQQQIVHQNRDKSRQPKTDSNKRTPRSRNRIPRYHCPFCQKGFEATNSLRGHLSWHTGIKEFKCKLCSKEFRYKNSLMSHVAFAHDTSLDVKE